MTGKSSDNEHLQAGETTADKDGFLVVGIGASAGGIQALKEFFSQVPNDSGNAYVVILHMSPQHESKLAEILQSSASIPVTQVRERIKVQPDHVYVIPPSHNLAMTGGDLELTHMIGAEERRSPVDLFFRTLADANDSRAVAVILSGTGANGSMGLKRIKEAGGVAFAQDPSEAQYTDMPRNAIATGLVDYVLPVREIPAKILTFKEHRDSLHIVDTSQSLVTDQQAMREIFTHLRTRTGQDFSNYKRATMLRRIERRLGINELTDLHEYARFLRTDKHEANALMKDMLISVTNFFRDHEHLEVVAKKVVPAILKSKTEDDSVRVWVAGCATGEETYSIAMVLSEAMTNMHSPHLQIFASDLDAEAIAKAREAHYSEAEVADVSPERLRRFFLKEHEGYRVRRELREQILFACHNLIKDPPFSHLDLISCRNVLIYLNRTAQTHVLEVMHFALNPGGYLFLGSSESIENADDFFTGFDRDHHIFQSRPVPTRHVFAPPDLAFKPLSFASPEKPRTAPETRAIERLSYVDLHQRLLEQISPPSVVINEDYEIVHLSDSAGHYMQVSGGEPTNNLLKLIRPELRLELRSALYQAVQQRIPVNTSEMSVRIEDGTTRPVRLSVRPVFREGDGTRGFVLVLFDEGEKSSPSPVKESSQSQEPITTHLEEELIQSKSQLRATVEQYEIQQEELRASNEELQAMNEELRSAAEELETSKEELQSVNEELITVNQELKIKIEELGHSNNDFINLMNSTDIGTIFLDRTLTLMMFTPRAQDVFNLIASDISRPLLHITHKLKYENLQSDIEEVIRTLHKLERDIETTDGRWFLMGILPYRTSEDRIDGVVMTFLEISSLKAAQQELENARSELEQRVEARTSDLRETNLALSAEVQEHLKTEVIRVKLLTQLVNAQEAERRRLARDLHDQLGQQLTALRLKLETLKVESDQSEKLSSDVDALLAITEQLDSDIDFLAWELRPFALDDLGLPEAMGVYINRWAEHFNIAAQFHSSGFDSQRLASDVENHLYRIVQEALNNAAKHSRASQVDVLLERRDHHAVLIIEDNGVGLSDQSQNSGSMGLSGMRERASILGGSFEIESTPKVGTTVFVRIPIDGQAQE